MTQTQQVEQNQAATREMIRAWVRMHNGDTEAVARWMARTLHVRPIRECRRLIAEAEAEQPNHIRETAEAARLAAKPTYYPGTEGTHYAGVRRADLNRNGGV